MQTRGNYHIQADMKQYVLTTLNIVFYVNMVEFVVIIFIISVRVMSWMIEYEMKNYLVCNGNCNIINLYCPIFFFTRNDK